MIKFAAFVSDAGTISRAVVVLWRESFVTCAVLIDRILCVMCIRIRFSLFLFS